jgi:hypothetical protein
MILYLDVLGGDVSDGSVSENKWVVVSLPDLDGSIAPLRSESGVDVVSVWVDRLDVVSLKDTNIIKNTKEKCTSRVEGQTTTK